MEEHNLKHNKETFTEKGLDTTKDHDKVLDDDDTMRAEREAFRRKPALARTPPLRRTLSLPGDDEEARSRYRKVEAMEEDDSVKRKRGEDSPTMITLIEKDHKKAREGRIPPPQRRESDVVASRARRIIEKIGGEVRRVTEVAKGKNTRKEVKDAAAKLSGLMSQLTSVEVQETLFGLGSNTQESAGRLQTDWEERLMRVEGEVKLLKETNAALAQDNARLRAELAQGTTRIQVETASIACQTEKGAWARKPEDPPKVDISGRVFNDFDEIIPVLDKPWERQCYASTKIIGANLLKATKGSIVFFAELGSTNVNKEARRMRDIYPELTHSEASICEGGSFIGVELTTRYSAAAGLATAVKNIIEMRFENTRDEVSSLRDIYGMLREARHITENSGVNEITVVVPPGISGDKFRKVTELAFRGADMAVYLTSAKGKKAPKKKKDREKGLGLVVESTAATYADTLREVKAKITDDVIRTIKGIRRTARGNLLVTFTDGANSACKKAAAALETDKVRIVGGGREKTVKIRDIDALQHASDVKTVLMEKLGVEDEKRLTITPLRPTPDGNQVADVILEASLASKLIALRRVKIGLSICRIQEKIDPGKCYRCWAYGHRAADCKGPDRSAACLRCSEEGHKKATCQRDAHCPLCNASHVAGSGQCSAFRKALNDARNRKSNDA